LVATKHALELIKNVAKGLALPTLSTSELLREALEASETLAATKWVTLAEGVLPAKRILRLLITCHACLVVDTSLSLVAQRLVRVVDLSKLFLGLFAGVHIRMKLLGHLKVGLLDIGLGSVPVQPKHPIIVIIGRARAIAGSATVFPSE